MSLRFCENPEFLKYLTSLRKISSYAPLSPDCLSTLTNLSELEIQDDTSVSNNALNHLINLESLYMILESNTIRDEDIMNLKKLTKLHCSNLITGEGIKHLTSLKYLWINERISQDAIRNFSNLIYLDVHYSARTSVRNNFRNFDISKFPNLEYFFGYFISKLSPFHRQRFTILESDDFSF
jgi:hypothetical protein